MEMLFELRVITTFLIQRKRLESRTLSSKEGGGTLGATSADRIADFANESGRVMKTLSATASTRCLSKKIHLLQNRVLGRVQDTLMVAIPIGPIAATAPATGRTRLYREQISLRERDGNCRYTFQTYS